MFLEKYKNLRRLGKGAFGSVYLVEDAQGVWFALKIIPTKRMKQ
jgi:serine/threonine protein kinase